MNNPISFKNLAEITQFKRPMRAVRIEPKQTSWNPGKVIKHRTFSEHMVSRISFNAPRKIVPLFLCLRKRVSVTSQMLMIIYNLKFIERLTVSNKRFWTSSANRGNFRNICKYGFLTFVDKIIRSQKTQQRHCTFLFEQSLCINQRIRCKKLKNITDPLCVLSAKKQRKSQSKRKKNIKQVGNHLDDLKSGISAIFFCKPETKY